MTRNGIIPRACLAAAATAALALLTAGCGGSDEPPSTPAPNPAVTPTGSAHAAANGVDLTISQVTAHLNASGSGTLTMTVRNAGSVTEHLDMIGTPGGGRGTLTGGATKDSGAMTSAGVQFLAGTATTFGGAGPSVHLTHATGVTSHHTLPVVMQFGVAGLVKVQARVTSS